MRSMDPERWQRIKDLCNEALAIDVAGRDAFLDEACGGDVALRAEVRSILSCAPQAEGFLETPATHPLSFRAEQGVAASTPPGADPTAHDLVGQRILHYDIVEKVGEGGMGVVYRAEDTRLAVNAAASFALLLHVHRNGEVGSPRVTGSTSASNAARRPGCASSIAGRPAPARRRRPAGAPPSANSRRPLRIVVRDKPVADETTASPPYPMATDSAAAHTRRARSFINGDNAAYFATSVASSSMFRFNDHC